MRFDYYVDAVARHLLGCYSSIVLVMALERKYRCLIRRRQNPIVHTVNPGSVIWKNALKI